MATYYSQQKRPRYFDRQQLSAQDLSLSQNYLIQRDRQLNQHLHGWGVVCGALPTQRSRMSIDITEGFGIAPDGQNIYIPNITNLDISDMVESLCIADSNKCEDEIEALDKKLKEAKALNEKALKEKAQEKNAKEALAAALLAAEKAQEYDDISAYENNKDKHAEMDKDAREDEDKQALKVLYLIAKPTQQQSNLQPAFPADCQHPGNNMQYSRVCDGVEICLVDKLSDLHREANTPCGAIESVLKKDNERTLKAALVRYFECPTAINALNNYVVLCTIIVTKNTLQLDEQKEEDEKKLRLISKEKRPQQSVFMIGTLKYASRTQLLSTSHIQQYLRCLCNADTPDEPQLGRPPIEKPPIKKPPIDKPKIDIPPTFSIDDYEGILSGDVSSLDIRYYDTLYGAGTYVESLKRVDSKQKARLKEAGYRSLLDIGLADTNSVANMLNVPEQAVLELRGEALTMMRRDEPITIPIEEYDIAKGLKTPTNELKEVGLVRQKRLREARINSVAHVANSSLETLESVLEVSNERAIRIQAHAKTMMKRP